jgi:hypothetical protein
VKDYLAVGAAIDLETFEAAHRYPFRAFNYLAIHKQPKA